MKSNYLYLLFICVISCLFVSCSDEDNKEKKFGMEPVQNNECLGLCAFV